MQIKTRLIAINYGSLYHNFNSEWLDDPVYFWTPRTLQSCPLLLHTSGRQTLSYAVAKASCTPLVFPCQLTPLRHAEPTETCEPFMWDYD